MDEELLLTGVDDGMTDFNDDQELGAIAAKKGVSLSPAQTSAAKAFANKKIQKREVGKTLTREQRFMNSKVNKLDSESQKAIREGNLAYDDADYYFRGQITGQAIQELLKASNVIKPGTTNLDKNYLPKFVNLILGQLRVAYGFDNSNPLITDPSKISYSNAYDANPGGAGGIPVQFLNAELEIMQSGKTIITLPVARFFRDDFSVSGSVQGVSDTVHLKALKVIHEGIPVTMHFIFPDGAAALPTGNHFYEIRWMGMQTREK